MFEATAIKMKEGTPLYNHLNDFNKIIFNLKNIDIKVDDDDQVSILLCSLLDFFDNFVISILSNRHTISLVNVKSLLNSTDVRTRLNEKCSDNEAHG